MPLPRKRLWVGAGGKQWTDGKQSVGWMFSACAAGWWPVARKRQHAHCHCCTAVCHVLF